MYCLKCRKEITGKDLCGLHRECFISWFQLDQGEQFRKLEKKHTFTSSGPTTFSESRDTFYHGRYRKYSGLLGGEKYILKMQEEKFPDLPEVEYICNRIAHFLNMDIPSYYLINFSGEWEQEEQDQDHSGGIITFVSKNFIKKGATLHHIYKFLPKGQEHYNCKNIIDVLRRETRRPVDVKTFVEICLFDAFIGNGDRHGRNLALIDTGKRGKKLAPMYDNPSFIGIEDEKLLGADIRPSGCIYTKYSKKPKVKDYLVEFKELGLNSHCLLFVRKIRKNFLKIKQEVEGSFILKKRKNRFIQFLRERLQDFEKCI